MIILGFILVLTDDHLSPEEVCSSNCDQFMRIRERAREMVNRWFARANSSIILTPSTSNLDYINDRTDDPFVTLIPVFTVAGLPALSMPVGYSKVNGVPIGMLLWSFHVDHTFTVGKYFESERDLRRLPPTTPLLDDKSTSSSSFHGPKNLHFLFFSIFMSIFYI